MLIYGSLGKTRGLCNAIFNWTLWEWLLPNTDNVLTRGRAELTVATCLGLAAAIGFILIFWVVSGSLEQIATVFAGLVLVLIFGGLGALARSGRATAALWALVGLLLALVTLNLVGYSIASTTSAAYVLPILLAACGLGLKAGLGVAGVSAACAWGLAWGEVAGWLPVSTPPDISRLTFDAPALTVIFVLAALIAGVWSQRWIGLSVKKR